ncbi:MAG: UxaA family hydrolase [Anaerolineales bacterium]|nr:UxaA family hydrolase [Anaerolineales bacterium]
MKFGILMHEAQDDVGVAVIDLKAGDEIGAATLEGQQVGSMVVVQDIPLGHKVAMRDLPQDKHIIEYGRAIGRATQPIGRGDHVHTHNLRTLRW